jgi:hypothetical protein
VVWLELGQAALVLVKDGDPDMTSASAARMLALVQRAGSSSIYKDQPITVTGVKFSGIMVLRV